MPSSSVYAIDFGTSNSLVSYVRPGDQSKLLKIDNDHDDPFTMRSLMYFPHEKGEASFGHSAIQNYIKEDGHGRFIRSIKKFLPATTFKATQIQGKLYSLEDIIGRFLTEIKTRADQITGEDVKSVMLGRPARFSDDDKKDETAQKRLHMAALQAGFENISFCPEPLAAALDYQQQIQTPKRVLVVDLGGGTSDFTVIELKPGKLDVIETLGLGGISVAGDTLDGTLMTKHIGPYFGTKVQYKLPMSNNVINMPPSLQKKLMSPADITLMSQTDIFRFVQEVQQSAVRPKDKEMLENLFTLVEDNLGFALYEEIERVKKQVCINKKDQFQFTKSGLDITQNITYEGFIECNTKNFKGIFESMNSVLQNSGLKTEDIDTIFTTGGTSNIPYIQSYLSDMFGPEKLHHQEAFHSVIKGLSVKAREKQ
ncbi:MAG: Hsp70 family protein [Bdellovibrionales bacterium]|nr:Hsp70 family protein [Bdellovibrionales bacterium]